MAHHSSETSSLKSNTYPTEPLPVMSSRENLDNPSKEDCGIQRSSSVLALRSPSIAVPTLLSCLSLVSFPSLTSDLDIIINCVDSDPSVSPKISFDAGSKTDADEFVLFVEDNSQINLYFVSNRRSVSPPLTNSERLLIANVNDTQRRTSTSKSTSDLTDRSKKGENSKFERSASAGVKRGSRDGNTSNES